MPKLSWLLCIVASFVSCTIAESPSTSTDGIKGLANRLLGSRAGDFAFTLTEEHEKYSRWNQPKNDNYTVSQDNGKIHIQGTTLSALARGLRHYATDTLQLDDFWFIDSYAQVKGPLPAPKKILTGTSIAPWRYHLNTVAFSYAFAWYKWEDWEKLLDWAAWRGINLQPADDEIFPFFSGPAFQAWNRFGNIKGSWGGLGGLPMAWIDAQFDLQKKIITRMIELGITPVLPVFSGFVPDAIHRARPNANVTKAEQWAQIPDDYSEDLWLDPYDDTYAELQRLFVEQQLDAFGNITNIYTLDQFNEMQPGSGNLDYLTGISKQTNQGLEAANPAAVWLMQGWLFFATSDFWTNERVEAYLGGVEDKSSWIILELIAEQMPQWQRTSSYGGRPWIWCQIHDLGGNMNLWGQVQKAVAGPIEAVEGSEMFMGVGIAPEAYEGNEVVYDILFDQAWSSSALDTKTYFQNWVSLRYGGVKSIPDPLFQAWELLRQYVYSNTAPDLHYVGNGVYQLEPALEGIANCTGFFPVPTAVGYDPKILKRVWQLMARAGIQELSLWNVPAFNLDFDDVTRQVMSNAFIDVYYELVVAFNDAMESSKSSSASNKVVAAGKRVLSLIKAIDLVLLTNDHFSMQKRLDAAKYWGNLTQSEDLFVFNARSQVTVWIWESPLLNDYSTRAWSGVTGSYYYQRWSIFIDGLKNATESGLYNATELTTKIRAFEKDWQYKGFTIKNSQARQGSLKDALQSVQKQWPEVFSI